MDTSSSGSTALGAVVPATHHGLRLVHGAHVLRAPTEKTAAVVSSEIDQARQDTVNLARAIPLERRAIQSTMNPQANQQRGVIGTMMRPVEAVDKVINKLSMLMLPAFLLLLPGGAMKWMGNRFNKAGLQKWGERLQTPMHKLVGGEGAQAWMVEDVGHVGSGVAKRVANFAGRRGWASVESTLTNAAERMAPLEARAIENVASATHTTMGHVGRFAGAVERRTSPILRTVEEVTPGLRTGSLSNLEHGVGNAFRGTGKIAVGNALWRAGAVTSTMVSTYNSARDLHGDLKALREVYASMLGKRPQEVSNWQLFFGNAPELIRHERHMLVARYGANALAIGLGAKVGWNFEGGRGLMTAMVLQMGITSMTPKLAKNSILPAYRAINEAHILGAPLMAQNYAPLVADLVSHPLRHHKGATRGAQEDEGMVDAETPSVLAIAAQYAQEKASPQQILAEARNGKLDERRIALEQPKTKPAVGPAAANEVRAQKTVMGQHTGKVVSQAASATQASALPSPAGGR